jgi:uncharacterized protein
LGGKISHGKQGISWIHEYDLNEIIFQAITNANYKGIYISSAPNSVSNAMFMKELRKQLKIPFGLPAPKFMVRLGASVLFKTDPELLLYGRYVKSERLEADGFVFKFPILSEALKDLV